MSSNEQIILREILNQEAENFDDGLTESQFFEFYSAVQILKDYELSYDEITNGIAGESHDGGADSIYLFVNGDLIREDSEVKEKYKKNPDIELVIIQSKKENGFGEDALLKLARLCTNLLDLGFDKKEFEGRYNNSIISAFELFRDTYVALVTKKPSLKVRIVYASLGMDIHANVQKQADDLQADVKEKLPSVDVKVEFVGATELVKFSQERASEVFRLATIDSPLSTSEKVFIALVRISDYYKFVSNSDGKLIRHIFESNVRDYQGKNSVNKEIQATLYEEGKEEFWWLNNGVTILATDATTPGGRELIIHNPQIVNGLQTSSEIHHFYSENPHRVDGETRSVLVRVIVPENEETRDRIIRATNSQTSIPKSSLRATDPIHRTIEDYFKSRTLFYDRRKNYYKNEGKKPKEIISLQFLSQCLMSTLLRKPDFARARPSTLLEKDESYEKLFHVNNSLPTYYLVAFWGRAIENRLKVLKKYETPEINDIKFYVLYIVSCGATQNLYPDSQKFAAVNVEDLKNDLIDEAAQACFDIYKELGGTDKVAKGSEMLEKVKAKAREKYGL
ncbi:MAG: hypothetical protein ACJATK_002363 [Paracoccaceae bacterium]|jgi:hypothetical protein